MTSLRARFYKAFLRRTFKPSLLIASHSGIKQIRADEENRGGFLAKLMRARAKKHLEPRTININGVEAHWLGKQDARDVLLYLHGGGYVIGSFKSHGAHTHSLAQGANMRALFLDYRLAPEHAFPAALEDAEAAYDYLLGEGIAPEHIYIAGDSAGGGLTLALLLQLRNKNKPQPRAVALLSPWADLTLSAPAIKERHQRDPMITSDHLTPCARFYLNGHDARDSLASPVFGDFTDLAPMLIHVGSEEVLYDDAIACAQNAERAGVPHRLRIWQDMPHVHQIAAALVPEAREAITDIQRFFAQYQ